MDRNPNPNMKTTSVLFVEQSRGGSLAQTLRKKMEALALMLGYRFKIVENAGTSLSSILSNKNLWPGAACGRKKCFPCQQESEKREQCSQENVLYESMCTLCNGKERSKDEMSLKDERENPSIYVGESSRSLMERTAEHHSDYAKNKEESHMTKHWANHHPGSSKPLFHQYIVKSFKSSLERQVAEAVRIQYRGNVLNSVGGFNRSKLTRLVVDQEWDQKVWEESVSQKRMSDKIQTALGEEGAMSIEEQEDITRKQATKRSRKDKIIVTNKKRKMESQDKGVWGEMAPEVEQARTNFLVSKPAQTGSKNLSQKMIVLLTQGEVVSAVIVKEVITRTVEVAAERAQLREMIESADMLHEDGDWEGDPHLDSGDQEGERPDYNFLVDMLEELDLKASKQEGIVAAPKPNPKKKRNLTKKQKLEEVAKNMKKITTFFTAKQKVEPRREVATPIPMEWEGPDLDMDWEDLPPIPWSDIIRTEQNRDRAVRRRRAALQRRAFNQQLEAKLKSRREMEEFLEEVILTDWWEAWSSEVTHPVEFMPGVRWTMAVDPALSPAAFHSSGTVEFTRGHSIEWTISTTVTDALEYLNTKRNNMKKDLTELLMNSVFEGIDKSITVREREETEKLVLATSNLSLAPTKLEKDDQEMEEASPKEEF